MDNNLGSRLKSVRIKNDMTLEELSNILGSTKTTLSRYENNKRNPNSEFLEEFSKYFNVSIDYLLGRTENEKLPCDNKTVNEKISTIAAHLDAEELSDDDLDDINKFIEFVKAKNKE